MRRKAEWVLALLVLVLVVATIQSPENWPFYMPLGLLTLVGVNDMRQTRHAIRRNFPVIGHLRYLFESIRPEINQYFIESNTDGAPFSREVRSLVYQRAKNQSDSVPFGTKRDVYAAGFETVRHSTFPTHVDPSSLRVRIGGPLCEKPYDSSIFIVSAMSFGALSGPAVESLNGGAKLGRFAHNTGEGGVSRYHLAAGGDLIWQIGTGYFGCRTKEGAFDEQAFARMAQRAEIKMIELKLSQGAKPGLGGLLPGEKVNAEIAEARGVPQGVNVVSPARHTTFSTFPDMFRFLHRLRELSGGKPVGFKLCVGIESEVEEMCAAILQTGLPPDFITIDGAEGGTGAAPLEYTNSVGVPLVDGLLTVTNALRRYGLRDKIKIIASGKVATGFDIVRAMALGADLCASARGMMLALGCIQALRCNSNRCPAGVATQDPYLISGLVVEDKSVRVAQYHKKTVDAVAHLLSSMGLEHTSEITADHVYRRGRDGELKPLSAHYSIAAGPEYLATVPAVSNERSEVHANG